VAIARTRKNQEGEGGRASSGGGTRGDRKTSSDARRAKAQGRFREGSEVEGGKAQRPAKIPTKILA